MTEAKADYLRKFEQEVMNPISPTFCLAKWYRTSVRFDHGVSYSCHHCKVEKINLEKLAGDPSAVTNTDAVMAHRQEMLDGARPKECEYCWQAEDKGEISDRIIKTHDIYTRLKEREPDLIEKTVASTSASPRILEICFDNTCNFKCSYCSPVCSSKFAEELVQFGPYPTKTTRTQPGDQRKILNREENPYAEAFWKWWPELRNELLEIRITGGEPMLSKRLYDLFDTIMEDDNPNLGITLNTNFCPTPDLFDKFMIYIHRMAAKAHKIRVFVSMESVGARAEYSRFGMDYKMFIANIERFMAETTNDFFFMLTNNALSITGLKAMLEYYVDLKRRYPNRVFLTSHLVRHPAYLDIRILPKELLRPFYDDLKQFMVDNDRHFFHDAKIQVNRSIEYMMEQAEFVKRKEREASLPDLQEDFVKFVDEYDRRRGTNFLQTFPEFAGFYHEVKQRGLSS